MNNKIAKKIRSIFPNDDEISRRVYRRLKKQYNKLSEKAKPIFLENAKRLLNGQEE
jgi:hypothetical protein